MIREDEVYKIGVLKAPHGVRGEINFQFTDDVWDRVEADYLICRVDGILVPFFLTEWRFRSDDCALLKFQDMESSEAVRVMSGLEVYFPFALTPEEAPEDATWSYFTGFRIVDEQAGELGTVEHVDDSTANVLFEIDGPHGELLVPAVEAFIRNIDHEHRTIQMALPEGLIELTD